MGILTAFRNSPDGGRGLARDFRVRWALEEVGQPYDLRLVSFGDMKKASHRERSPFGQIPTWEDGDTRLFESGAIVLHIAENHAGLLPIDKDARARAIVWMFSALDTVEPPIWDWDLARMVEHGSPWHSKRLPMLESRIDQRLSELASWLGDKHWLEDDFTAGDLLMVSVLRRLDGSDLLAQHPTLMQYVDRAEGRPAFVRAFDSQKLGDARRAAPRSTPPQKAMKRPTVCIPPGEGRRYQMEKLTAWFKADGDETQNQFSASEWLLLPGQTGVGLHDHDRNDELFLILEGNPEFWLGNEWAACPVGTFLFIPAGTEHDFRNLSHEPARFFSVFIGDGFEKNMPTIVEWFSRQ